MNRRLVITNEGARHPFRQKLPARVLRALPQPEPEVARCIADRERLEALQHDEVESPVFQWQTGILELAVPAFETDLITPAAETPAIGPQATPQPAELRGWRFAWSDVRDFALAYCACFVAVSAYIS